MDSRQITAQLEHLQAKHAGTGHPNIDKHTWLINQHRDTLASHIAHHYSLEYIALAENESQERTRLRLLNQMINPCVPRT